MVPDTTPTLAAPVATARPRRSRAASLAIISMVLAVFFSPALLGPGQFVHRDGGRMHEPVKRFIAEELRAGRFPQWNPYLGLGTPMVAGAIDGVLHPFTALLAVLPFEIAYKAWVLLSFLGAALGGMAWARARGSGEAASAAAGLAFALSGPLVSASDNVTYLTTYAALPWIFAGVHRFVARPGPGALGWVLGASGACAAAGDPQGWGLAAVALLPYAAFLAVPSGQRARGAVRGAVALLAALAGAAPAVLPLAVWWRAAHRAAMVDAVDAARWNLHPLRLAEIGLPGMFRGDPREPVSPVFAAFTGESAGLPWFLSLYVGATAIVLAWHGARRSRSARGLLLVAGLAAWAATGPHLGFAALAARLPVVGTFRYWEKLAVWIALAVTAAAADGIDALAGAHPARGRFPAWAAAGSAAGIALAVMASFAPQVMAAGRPAGLAGALAANVAAGAVHAAAVLGLLALVALALARGRLRGAGAGALGAVLVLDLAAANVGAYVLGPTPPRDPPPLARALREASLPRVATPFTLREDRWPELGREGSTWEWARRTLAPSFDVPMRVGNFIPYAGLHEARLHRLWVTLGADPSRTPIEGLWGVEYLVVPGAVEVAAKAGLVPPFETRGEDPALPAWLAEMPHRPRAYLAGEVSATDEEGAYRFALEGGVAGRTVVEGAVPPGLSPGSGEARVVADLPGDTRVETVSGGAALLVLNDALIPGWNATLDGATVPILRANYLARGVWVPPGRHEIRFRYRTPGLLAGAALAIAAVLAIAGWAMVRRRRPPFPTTSVA